jgi:hypothetical protein
MQGCFLGNRPVLWDKLGYRCAVNWSAPLESGSRVHSNQGSPCPLLERNEGQVTTGLKCAQRVTFFDAHQAGCYNLPDELSAEAHA